MRPATPLAVLALLATSCHGGGPAIAPKPLTAVEQLPPLPARAVQSIVELDGNVYVFDAAGVSVVRAGTLVAHDDLEAAGAPSTIAAPDGEGTWVVRALHRISADGELTPIAEERLGLTPHGAWSGVYGAGPTTVATSATQLAIAADGHHVAIYPAPHADALAVARNRLALATRTTIDVWDLAAGVSHAYPLGGAHVAFADADADATTSRLVAWTAQQLAVEGADHVLHRVATPTPIASVVASGSRVWVWAGGTLAYLDPGARALASVTLDTAHVTAIFGSASGDVWLARDQAHLARYSLSPVIGDPAWSAQVAPVFARVCSKCHLPGGTAGVDLSTPALWQTERDEIRQRVVLAHSMPPAGTPPLGDGDRDAIAAWLGTVSPLSPVGTPHP